MGANGIRVTKPSEIASAIEQAIASNRPTVVDIVADVTAMAPPAYRGDTAKPAAVYASADDQGDALQGEGCAVPAVPAASRD